MSKSTAAGAAARFRQLSCFGLDARVAIPEMLRELHALVPSYSNSFFFADGRPIVTDVYVENTSVMKLFPLYEKEFHEIRERQFPGLAFSDAARTQIGVQDRRTGVAVDEKTFLRSDYFNVIPRQVGYGNNFLRLYFRDADRVLGGLTMWSSPGAEEWSQEDWRRLASLKSFFAHALKVRRASDMTVVDSGESGLIIADPAGKPVHFSAEGRRLLFLATSPRSMPGTVIRRSNILPRPVVQICRSLDRIFHGDFSTSAPTCHHSNAWGGFTFRAQWLDPDHQEIGLIGITITHKVPLPIRLMRNVRKLPLSRRQAEVCVLLAAGATNETVAERLGISKHTAGEHARAIYNKLDVHTRAELINKVLSPA